MSTRKVYCSYQEVIDLHTESDKVTAIGFHVPDTDTPHKMFGGFYDQFKKVKYLGMSVTFVPVAKLPVDPLGVSYEAGEPTMDPRDVVNPILLHGCHGNDMGTILNNLYTGVGGGTPDLVDVYNTDSSDIMMFRNTEEQPVEAANIKTLENLYYKALVDNTWQKAHPQKGFKKAGLHPMVYNLVTNHQIAPGLPVDVPQVISDGLGVPAGFSTTPGQQGFSNFNQNVSFGKLHMFTNRLVPMGWMDTRNVLIAPKSVRIHADSDMTEAMAELLDKTTTRSKFEPIYMLMCLLPPAYKTEQYFRCVINHNFVFAGFRGMSFNNSDLDEGAPSVFDLNEEMSVGDDNGGDDNGGDDNGGGDDPPVDETPVITLSNYSGGFYTVYSIDGSESVNLNSKYLTVSLADSSSAYLGHLVVSDGKIYGHTTPGYFDFQTMKYGSTLSSELTNSFTITNANDNTDLIELLQSGDYTVEVDNE